MNIRYLLLATFSASSAAFSSPIIFASHSKTAIFSTRNEKDTRDVDESAIFADADATVKKLSKDQQDRKVGSLVADDEWSGIAMEMTKVLSTAIVEDAKKKKNKLKKTTTDFMGTEDYSTADVLKALDQKVKSEVANLRGKEDYEIGDLTLALDEISKDLACKVIGKEGDYEFGDLSREVDSRIKNVVADYCGKDSYECE